MSLFATYSTAGAAASPTTLYLGISAPARTESTCPACQAPIGVGDSVVRAAAPGRCWVVHEGCAHLVAVD